MKKWMGVAALLLVLVVSTAACAQEMTFVDSLGREKTFEEPISRYAVTGTMAQITLFAIAPDEMVGVSSEWDEAARAYIPEKYFGLPVVGQIYGGKGSMNLEELLASDAQVVIDVGEAKKNCAEDLDALEEQTGIPFVHIDASAFTLDETYQMLGELLGKQEEAAALSAYCKEAVDQAKTIAETVEKKKFLYVVGEEGNHVIAKDSYHSEIIDLLTDNVAVVEEPSSRGTGNEVDGEQILLWNPEVVIFAKDSIYETAAEDPLWQSVEAIKNGQYFEAPFGPYNWMGFPPSAQRILGMKWMAKVLYPEAVEYDLYEEVAEYFDLFYHTELTKEQYDVLMQNAL